MAEGMARNPDLPIEPAIAVVCHPYSLAPSCRWPYTFVDPRGLPLPGKASRWLLRGSATVALSLGIGASVLAAMLVIDGTRPPAQIAVVPRMAHIDKLLHFVAHFVLTGFLGGALLCWPATTLRARLRMGLCAAGGIDLVFGVTVELVQGYWGASAGRQFEWADIAANMAGAICALMVIRVVVRAALGAYIKRGRAKAQTL